MSLNTEVKKFEGFLDIAGKEFEKGLSAVVKLAPAIEPLVAVLFPNISSSVVSQVTAALNLIQSSIISIEQKYAASGTQSGTGIPKAEEVIALAAPAVSQLLSTAGVKDTSTSYISKLIDAVVGVLNVTQPPATVAAS